MPGKYIIMLFYLLICFSCHGQNLEPMETDIHKKLYPYLGANDLYGYADSEGNLQIEPQYSDAGFFQNEVAVVRIEGEKEKLISADNQEIKIPIKYNELRLHTFSGYTILELIEIYSNRWRFWEWKFLPDFSFMGSSTRNRLFDTEVIREKRSLYWLEGGHLIQSKKGGLGKGETHFYVASVNENKVQIDDKFYRIENQRVQQIVKNVKTGRIVKGGYFLQKKRGYFQLIDSTGTKVSDKKFQPLSEISLEVEGKPFTLSTETPYPPHKSANFYKDDNEHLYIYPDLSKQFPSQINAYPFQDSITAMQILDRAQSFISIPDSDRFLLVLNHGKNIYALDSNGHWQNPNENRSQIKVLTRSGNHVWPPASYELGKPELPEAWKISSFRSLNKSENWYKVHIRNEEKRSQGVWNSDSQTWIMPPIYYQTGYSIERNRFISFQEEKDGKWGFYDLENEQVHIPPTYRSVSGTGWVYVDGMGSRKGFYLDVETKREFREK